MNRQIVQLFGLFTFLFAILLIFTSRWTVFEANSLTDNQYNRRPLIEEQKIPRGFIYADDGRTVLARNRGHGHGENRTYTRTYPQGGLFAHPVGFSYLRNGQRGLESSRNDELVGKEDEFASILSGLESRDREGNDVVTNLDLKGTQAAVNGLAGRTGAVVAIEPTTGKVRVMVSIPEYDPNLIPSRFGELNSDPGKPLLNRTTQELYPPGSTFKVVTATAALDSGKITPETVIDGSSPKTISGAAAQQRGRRELRADLRHGCAHELGQHLLGSGRRAHRDRHAGRVHEALRLLREAAARLSRGLDGRQRRPPQRGEVRRRRLRRGPRRDRPGRY